MAPDAEDNGPIAMFHAKHARMLVHENVWGIMATTSVTFQGSAFANVVSYSGEGAVTNVSPCMEVF